MVPTKGQKFALQQLQRIANVEQSALKIRNVREKATAADCLKVDISLCCSHYPYLEGGLKLHTRESVRLWIPEDFPHQVPSVTTFHTRFRGFAHVQWEDQLCLYQSPDTQWQPSLGMFGFMKQLSAWFRKSAINELDDPEGPLHPPIAYPVADTTIYLNADTPGRDQWPWLGAAVLNRRKSNMLEITGWQEVASISNNQQFALAILLDSELSFEYPTTIRELLAQMKKQDIETSRVLVRLILASHHLADGDSLHVVIGAPSRGIAGDKEQRLQHLQVWELEAGAVKVLREIAKTCGMMNCFKGQEIPPEIQEFINSRFDTLLKWQNESKVRWCSIVENRPEIMVPRDKGTAMDWFKGKSIAIFGCGALGGCIAEHLARASVGTLELYDNKKVSPSLLVRQNFVYDNINLGKAEALRQRLDSIGLGVKVTAHSSNIIRNTLRSEAWQEGVDLVIDATGSLLVRSKLEAVLKYQAQKAPLAAMMVSGAARHGALVLAAVDYSGGPLDVFRRLGLAAMNRIWLQDWIKAFWDRETGEPTRQPEPGCSEPTFVGSHADVAGLAARMLNRIAMELASKRSGAMGCLLAQDANEKPDHVFHFKPDIVINNDDLHFRLSAAAWRDVHGWIRAGARERSPEDETGGLLFGQLDESLGIAWISNVSGPPDHSKFSPEMFICGTHGTQQLSEEYEKRSKGNIRYVGTWHSHPISSAVPSKMDYAGISSIFSKNLRQGVHQLMMIIGHASQPNIEIGMYAFEKQVLKEYQGNMALDMMSKGCITAPPISCVGNTIGLALSGGGSRAVAFHLGTLRALEDLGLLDEISVISGVSGGSLITGLFGYSSAQFSQLDARTVAFLKKGLVLPAWMKLIHPYRAAKLLATLILVNLPTLVCCFFRAILSPLASCFSGNAWVNVLIRMLRWPFPRWYSHTHVMADAISDLVGELRCNAPTRQDKDIVFNACELSTGTAFRMSNKKFGTWRIGWAPASKLRLADAITASAAYPPFLPPYDWTFVPSSSGKSKKTHVIVTDGGVFDNLGVSVMEPGRDPSISMISYSPKIIISSDAGHGQFSGSAVPVGWSDRMKQVVYSVMRKVEDATKQRLHYYSEHGQLDRFVYVHLGQMDAKVPIKSPNWIDRETVVDYPTNFSAMSDNTIQEISGRGEAITRALVTQYLFSD